MMGFSKEKKAELERIESEDTKLCIGCGEVKPLFEFGVAPTGHKMACSYCIDCDCERRKERKILYNHGITLEDYDKMLEEQNGKCKICDSKETGTKHRGRFCVDHDHSTGRIRGLLCFNCNTFLGNAKDDIEILASAIQYLVNSRK